MRVDKMTEEEREQMKHKKETVEKSSGETKDLL